jgi:hypothetical protein
LLWDLIGAIAIVAGGRGSGDYSRGMFNVYEVATAKVDSYYDIRYYVTRW